MHALEPDSKELLIFVTPEWMTKPANQAKLHTLVRANQLSLIAIDEAHLFTEWSEFRTAFSDLRNIKSHLPSIPIMCLTATATPAVEEDIKLLLRNPFVQKMSMNRPNVTLNVEELKEDKSLNHAEQFAKRASEICGSSSSIVYTDFIADIGPIVSALQQVGVEAVGYHGEMDAPSRQESYLKWKSGQVQTIVATKAFGMGIDKPDIRHVIRSGVPESILSWAQELGRAGRDGQQACATILYRRSDISHANAWILNNLSNKERCRCILSNFSESWRFVNANLAGMCRRKLLLEMFGEESTSSTYTEDCCDVCMYEEHIDSDFKEELKVLIDAVDHLGGMGEVKIAEWIRGSKIAWTNGFDKNCLSYGNHKGKDMNFWRTFIRQCNVISLVQLELKSMIKGSGLYTVNGVYYVTPKGREALVESESLLLPDKSTDGKETSSATAQGGVSLENLQAKKKRLGKGSNILTTVRKLLSESENWFNIENKSNYQFPGVLPKPCFQQLFYTANLSSLAQSCEDPHFILKDIQLSKGQLNRDRLISVEIHGKTEEVYYRSVPCLGVKICPRGGCNHVVPIRDKRNCPEHNIALEKTYHCPVVFIYMYPKSSADSRHWFGGIVRCQKAPAGNLHNREIHAPSRITQCIKEKITDAISANPALTPSEIACGKGLGFIPSAVDGASSHTGKVSQEIRKTKQRKGLMDKDWSPMNFEEVADTIDEEDNEISGDGSEKLKKYKRHGRPYLGAFGLEDGIKFIFTMSPIMTKVASEADFIQCDITYDSCKDYPYIFNHIILYNSLLIFLILQLINIFIASMNNYIILHNHILYITSPIYDKVHL